MVPLPPAVSTIQIQGFNFYVLTFLLYNGSKSNLLLLNLDKSMSLSNNKVFLLYIIIITLLTKSNIFL
jgi:hypothetical protein